jgi:hypothetical protein
MSLMTLKYPRIRASGGILAAGAAAKQPEPKGKQFGCGGAHANQTVWIWMFRNRKELGIWTARESFWRVAGERGFIR